MQNGGPSHEIHWLKVQPRDCLNHGVSRRSRTATNLAVQRPIFVAKSRAYGDANHATKYRKIKSIHPRVEAYNQHVKWSPEPRDASAQTPISDSLDAGL